MPVVSGYRILVFEEYEKLDGLLGALTKHPPSSLKLYEARVSKIDLAKLVALVEQPNV